MIRLVLLLSAILAAAIGLSWVADEPGTLVVNWRGYEYETSVFRAIVMLLFLLGLAVVLWSLVRNLWHAPANVGLFFNRRRQRRGLDALSSGIIAVSSGDRMAALQHAIAARRALPEEPLTHLLRAQAAQLNDDRVTTRRIYEAMLGAPETELLGLRGLFIEAEREGEPEVARQFAERALAANPKLPWPADALFDLQAKTGDWAGALKTLNSARKHGHIDKRTADRRRAILLTAMAQAAEDADSNRALNLATEAHALAPDLVPAAAIAGRQLAARGNTPKAAKVIQRTWRLSPHPELATAYAYARLGDSPHDRLARVAQLAAIAPNSAESSIALASAAIEARDYEQARAALAPLLDGRLTQRVAKLMAQIEGAEHGDKGRVREWLARAVNAPPDPAWTADGRVSETWQPLSPVTKTLGAFEWRVPAEPVEGRDLERIAAKLEELVSLGAMAAPMPALVAAMAVENDVVEAAESPAEAEAVIAPVPPARARETIAEAVTPVVREATGPIAQTARPVPADTETPATPETESRLAEYTPPRPAYAASLVSRKKLPRLPADAPGAPASVPNPSREAALAAGVALATRAAPTRPDSPPVAKIASAEPVTEPPAASRPPTVAPTGQAAAPLPRVPGATRKQAGSVKPEPKIFVSPRAPDDPGPEPAAATSDRNARTL